MKLSTGIIRRVDELGRIVIPKEMRKELGIDQKDPIEISIEGSNIVLRKYENKCVLGFIQTILSYIRDRCTELEEVIYNFELEIPYEYGIVKEIINEDGYKIVKTDKKEITCKNVIIATGRRPRELGISNEKKLLGHGVSYCAICDGTLYKNKEVCVVGGGNSAFEAALYLSDICKKVTLVHRTNEFRAEKMNQDKVFSKENIEVITNSKIKEIKERNDVLEGIVLDNGNTIEVSALFVYVGNVPGSIKCENLSTEENYIIVDNNMKTNVDGIYACGDAIKKSVYQISTATAEGTIAAMSIINSK